MITEIVVIVVLIVLFIIIVIQRQYKKIDRNDDITVLLLKLQQLTAKDKSVDNTQHQPDNHPNQPNQHQPDNHPNQPDKQIPMNVNHCPKKCSPFQEPNMWFPKGNCSDPLNWGFLYTLGKCKKVVSPHPRLFPPPSNIVSPPINQVIL